MTIDLGYSDDVVRSQGSAEQTAAVGRPYPRGYRARLDARAAKSLKKLHATALWRMAARALGVHAMAFALMLGFCWLLKSGPAAAFLVLLPAWLLMAREQRVLELLIHNASHRNWSRNRLVNGAASTLLAGVPMCNSIAAYWASHRIHHHEYGSTRDPDRAGFAVLGPLDFGERRAAFKWLIRYAIQYYRAIGASPRVLAAFLAWHGIVYILPLSLLAGPAAAVGAWAALWLFPMLTLLSALRSIAEREEHDYELGSTEFTTTFTNRGRAHRLWFHPWNDHYHLLHHLYPGIPQFNHVAAHRLLMRHDREYRRCRFRLAILGQPVEARDVPASISRWEHTNEPEQTRRGAAAPGDNRPRTPARAERRPKKSTVRLPAAMRAEDAPPVFKASPTAAKAAPPPSAP